MSSLPRTSGLPPGWRAPGPGSNPPPRMKESTTGVKPAESSASPSTGTPPRMRRALRFAPRHDRRVLFRGVNFKNTQFNGEHLQ